MAIIGNGITTGAAGLDGMITVSDTQPTVPSNKVWVKETPGEIEIPTVDELEELKGEFESTVDYTESYNTVSGDIVSFDDGVAGKSLHKLLGTIEPVQDLHGQDSPYPAGGGKNKACDVFSQYIKPDNYYVLPVDLSAASTWQFHATLVGTKISGIVFGFVKDGDRYSNFVGLISAVNSDGNTFSFNVNVDSSFVSPKLVCYCSGETQFNQIFANYHIQFEPGSTVTAYSPYANICPISGHTGVEVNVSGVNVWDEEWEVGTIGTSNGANASSSVTLRSKNYISVSSEESYRFVRPEQSEFIYIFFYDINKTYIGVLTAPSTNVFEVPDGAAYMRFAYTYYIQKYTTYQNDISINHPSTDTEHHPYQGIVTPISWQSKAGTIYGGSIDVASGKLIATMGMVDLGTLDWASDSNRPGIFYSSAISDADSINFAVICSDYKVHNNAGPNYLNNGEIGSTNAYASKTVFIKNTDYTGKSETEVKSLLSGVQLVYELATPIEYNLSSRAIKTLSGQNNIWIDTGSITECEYVTATGSVIDKLLPEATDEDLGKALLVKTVEDGRVTEYELGDVKEDLSGLAHVIIDTASGDIATFTDGADNQPIQKLVATIEPVQDLHGYENPWPAGWKNMFRTTATSKTESGVTWTVNSDGSVRASGTATGYTDIYVGEARCSSSDGVVTISCSAIDDNNVVWNNISVYDNANNALYTISEGLNAKSFNIDLSNYSAAYLIKAGLKRNNNAAVSGTYKIQVEKGSTATDWVPYSNICPISGRTGMTIVRTGKNLIPEVYNYSAYNPTFEDAVFLRAGTYYLSYNVTNASKWRFNIRYYYSDGSINRSTDYRPAENDSIYNFYYTNTEAWQYAADTTRSSHKISFPKDVWVVIFLSSGEVTSETTISNSSLSFDSNDSYHPYIGTTLPINWQTEAGTIYGGTLMLNEDRSADVVADYGQKELDGSSDETYSVYGTPAFFYTTGTWMNDMRSGNYQSGWCNLLDVATGAGNTNPNVRFGGGDQAVYIYLQGSVSGVTDIATFRTWLASNPLQIVYPLATPQTYHFSDIGQLNTVFGANNVWSSAGPVEVNYPADTKLYIDKKISEAVAALGS